MNAPAGGLARAVSLALLWTLGAAAAIWLIALDISRAEGWVVGDQVMIGRDFLNLWTAGNAVADGRTGLLYDVEAYRAYQQALVGHGLDVHNYSYPPLGLPLTLPFGGLPYPLALALWLAGTGALFAHAARPWMREARLPAFLALLLPASLLNIWTGHYGFLIGAFWLYGWRALDHAPRRAGIVLGLIALKPHIGLLIPLILALRRRRRAFAAAALTVAALLLLSLALFGPSLWIDYISRTTREQAGMIDAGAAFFGAMSTSTATAVHALGGGAALALVAQAAMAIAGIAMVVDAAARGARHADLGLLAATATFLILPYAFIYDLTVVSLAAAWLLHARWRDLGVLERIGAGLGFLAPQLGFVLAWRCDVAITPLLLLALAVAQWRLIRRDTAADFVATGPGQMPGNPVNG